MKKSLFFWLYFVASIILAVYFSTRIITSIMGRGPISHVKHISILSDSKNTNFEPIMLAIGINSGINIKSVDLHQITNRITGIPGIKNASVRRLANGDIVIKIEHHKVAAQWTDGLHYYPLSIDGTKIDTPSTERNANTIVFQNVNDNDLKKIDLNKVVNSLSPIAEYIDYINMIESRRWNIHTKSGTTIYLPETDPSIAINKISVLNQSHSILSRNIDVIDMRDNARILVKTRK